MNAKYVILLAALTVTGCQWPWSKKNAVAGYTTIAVDPQRNTEAARLHTIRGLESLEKSDYDEAEKHFKAALLQDVYFGLAHNGLGTVYYRRSQYYLAAWEFQYAATYMPNRPEPRNNLGRTLEASMKYKNAARWYEKALELSPDCAEVIGNLARIYVRENRKDSRTRELLEQLVMKDIRPEWTQWARLRLLSMPKPLAGEAPPTETPGKQD